MIETLTIASVGHRGDGVVDTPGGQRFVSYALPGETVEVDAEPGHPERRHLLRVITASPERIAPFCRHFCTCGGCAIQHWSEPHYRAWKRGLVVDALSQDGIDAPVGEYLDAHGAGRRRATFHVRSGDDGVLQVGFAAPRAHEIVSIERCPILVPALANATTIARTIAETLKDTRKPLDIQFTVTDAGLDVDVRGSGAINSKRTAQLAALAEKYRLARLTRHGELVIQRTPPTIKVGRCMVTLPPGAFLQATVEGETTLARLIEDAIPKAKAIADLFCGVGPFALRLAERARITAADDDAGAIGALAKAATMASGLKPIDAQVRDLFRRPFTVKELAAFDAVVFDPPRQGAQSQAQELAASKVKTVVAVSCNAATFARDARILIDGGYRLVQVTPVDQFRHSAHVELVGKFER